MVLLARCCSPPPLLLLLPLLARAFSNKRLPLHTRLHGRRMCTSCGLPFGAWARHSQGFSGLQCWLCLAWLAVDARPVRVRPRAVSGR